MLVCTCYMGTGGIRAALRCSRQPQCHRDRCGILAFLAQMALTEALGTDGARLSDVLVEDVFQTEPVVMLWAHWVVCCIETPSLLILVPQAFS